MNHSSKTKIPIGEMKQRHRGTEMLYQLLTKRRKDTIMNLKHINIHFIQIHQQHIKDTELTKSVKITKCSCFALQVQYLLLFMYIFRDSMQ